MNIRLNAVILSLMLLTGTATAADYALVMPSGAVVPCSEVSKVRFQDMPRLYGQNNFSQEYQQYTRFHTFAPQDCKRAAVRGERESLAKRESQQPWQLVAQK